jgi:ATP-binding cassette, subfamily G (WHITE), member 2, SNQ2
MYAHILDFEQFKLTGFSQDLRITGLGANAVYQPTISSVLNPLNLRHTIQNIIHPPVKDIISGFEGTLQPGEMLLVLGKPGSGCTSLLKVLANQREGFHSINGDLTYDGISPQFMHKHYRGDLGYAPEDDIHFPSLTVHETLVSLLLFSCLSLCHFSLSIRPLRPLVGHLKCEPKV